MTIKKNTISNDRRSDGVKKILMVTKNWVGDILFEFPVIENIKKKYPDSKIVCIAPKRCHELLLNHPDIDDVLLFDEKSEHRSIFARLKFALALRKEKWDQSYIFHRSKTRAFILWFAGVKERIGFGGSRRFFLTHAVDEPKPTYHQVDHFLKLLDGLGIAYPKNQPYQFYCKPEDEEGAKRLIGEYQLKSFACFHLGANWEPKRWPPKSFAQLADKLYEKFGLTIVVTGAPRDMPLFDAMEKEVKQAKVVCLVGKTGLGELGALFKRAAFLVSGDSGPLHIASGVGTPVVALFGPTDPYLTGARGVGPVELLWYVPPGYAAPWYGESFPREGWLSKITPEEVFEAIIKRGWADQPLNQTREPKSIQKTYFDWGKSFDSPKRKKKKILVVTLSNIGDVILTTPVISALSKQFPNHSIRVVTSPRALSLVEGSHLVDQAIMYDKKASLSKKWKFIRKLQTDTYDMVIDLRNTMIPYFVIAGKRSPAIRPKSKQVPYYIQHLDILKSMGLDYEYEARFDFYGDREEDSFLRKIKSMGVKAQKDWILVSAAAASELKTWKFEGFKEVISKLLETQSHPILLVGDKREMEIVEPLTHLDPSRVFNVAGRTSLRELAVAVARSKLLLANDSAVMHLGFEMDIPTVAVFGPTCEHRYGRQGKRFKMLRGDFPCPCDKTIHRLESEDPFKGLNSETVFEACEELLHETPVAL